MRLLLIFPALALAACSPEPPDMDVQPMPTPVMGIPITAEDPWLAKFRAVHGSAYDPNSRLDREKMAALKREVYRNPDTPPTVKESLPVAPVVKDSLTTREAVLNVSRKLIGQTETHGSNRSPVIDAMNRLTGVPIGSPYCASFNAWCYQEGGAPPGWPKSAWSPDWVKSPTWTAGKGGKTPRPADAFGIWGKNPNKPPAPPYRIIHTGLVESWGTTSAVTIEGNTSPSAEFGSTSDRDGHGIWRKRRLIRQIHSARDWIK